METYTLTDDEISTAIAIYLMEEKGLNLTEGMLYFTKNNDNTYRITIHKTDTTLAVQ